MQTLSVNTNKIRVLCVIETLGRGGGAEQLVFSLAPEFRKLDVEVEFVDLFSWHDDLGSDLELFGYKVHRTNLSHSWSFINGLLKLHKIVKNGQFDVLWGHLYLGNLYVQLAKLLLCRSPSIVTFHSEGYKKSPPKSLRAKVRTYIECWLNSRANVRVGVSHAVANDYQAYFGWDDVQVVYNGVSTLKIPTRISWDEHLAIRTSHGISEDDFLIIVPARLVKEKGHIFLLKALDILKFEEKILPKVILLGEKGGEYVNIERYILEHELNEAVSIKAPLVHPDLFALMLAANVVVLPSLCEAFGIAAAEAMATGTPVILTKVGGLIELVGDSECALMVQPESPNELASAICRLMTDREFAVKLGARGKQRIMDNFDISRCASAWRDQFVYVAGHKLSMSSTTLRN